MRTIEELSPWELEKIAALKRMSVHIIKTDTVISTSPKPDQFLCDVITESDMNRIKEFICGVIEYRIKEVAK